MTDREDVSSSAPTTGKPSAFTQEWFIYAAQEDTTTALEAERRRMAHLLDEQVIRPLNLLLAQTNVYEQTLPGHPPTQIALSVLSALLKQALQQARDLETGLQPTILETLGLEPALETLAGQEMRTRGVRVTLNLPRMRERLSAPMELALFRLTQEAIDRAVRQAHATRISLRLERRPEEILFCIGADGNPPTGELLSSAVRPTVEALGGNVAAQRSALGGLELIVRFAVEPPVDLTERELEVIRLLAEGLRNKEIAARLSISSRTVKFHLDNIYSKLGVNSRTEAAVYALRRGWARQPGATSPVRLDG